MKTRWSRYRSRRSGYGVVLVLALFAPGLPVQGQPRPVEEYPRAVEARKRAAEAKAQAAEARKRTVEERPRAVQTRPRLVEERPRPAESQPQAVEGAVQGVLGPARAVQAQPRNLVRPAPPVRFVDRPGGLHLRSGPVARYLYVWAGHVNHDVADFLAVIDFDADSPGYGRVVNMVQLPGPGASFNEPHHMHLSADGNILGCGGLLSVLSGQPGIFFFDTSNPREPRFLFSTSDTLSSITDDFYPLPQGGFLVSQMGSANGDAPGRIVEFDRTLRQVGSWPSAPPTDGFNPHGISVRPEINLMMTSDFILPDSTLNVSEGSPILRNTIRVWNFQKRRIVKTIAAPDAMGTMDVRLIPGDPRGRAYTAGMFNGLIYLVDPIGGSATPVFDTSSQGGMPQILQLNRGGTRLLTGLFQSGRIIMLDTTRRFLLRQVASVDLGEGAGPHNIMLTDDDKRLVVTDYFLDEDDFPHANPGKVRLNGDHKVHVLKVSPHSLELDPRFNLDFNTAFSTGPARPHGIAIR